MTVKVSRVGEWTAAETGKKSQETQKLEGAGVVK